MLPSRATSVVALERWAPLVAVVAVFIAAQTLPYPVVFPDESASLASARYVAGLGSASQWWFQPGYGILLSPAFLISTDLSWVMTWVHAVNAVLVGSIVMMLISIDRQLVPDRSSRHRVAAALLAASYPAYVYFAAQAIPDNLLVACAVLSVWLLVRLDRAATLRSTAVASAIVVVFPAVHARALPIVVAWACVIAYRQAGAAKRAAVGMGIVGGGVAIYALARLLVDYRAETALASLTRQSVVDLIADLLAVRALLVLPFTALGSAMYLLMASLGLFAVGVFWGVESYRSGAVRRDVLVYVAGSFVLTFAASAVFTNQGQGDLAMYGRYAEVGAVLPLFWGVTAALERPLPGWFRSRLLPGLILLVCFVVGIRGYDAFGGRNQLLNVTGTAFVYRLVGQLDPVVYVVLIGIVMLVMHRVSLWRPASAGLVVLGFFVANAWVLLDNARTFAFRSSERLTLLDHVSEVDPAECVALDQAGLTDFFTQENYRVNDLRRDYVFWSAGEGGIPPCDIVVSENSALSAELVGWRPVASESERPAWLWVSPRFEGQFADRIIRPLPGQPLFEPEASVVVSVSDLTIDASAEAEVVVSLENVSAQTFVPVSGVVDGVGGVMLGLEWRDPDAPNERLHEPVRIPVPSVLRPGETVQIVGALPVAVPDASIEGGDWLVRAELVQEFVQWFGNEGGGAVAVTVIEEGEG